MIHDCIGQYGWFAADIGFNLENLRSGFWQFTIDGLAWGAIYALVAVGYTLVFGVLRLINFAHSEIFMLGMFGAYFALDVIWASTPSGNAYNQGVTLTVVYLGRRDAVRDGGIRFGRSRIGVRRLPAAAQTQRPVADLPDHRDRHVVRAAGVRALRAAADPQGLRRQQRPAADHPGAAEDAVHDVRRLGHQRHAGDHRRRADLRLADRPRRSTGPSSAAESARSPRTRPPRR